MLGRAGCVVSMALAVVACAGGEDVGADHCVPGHQVSCACPNGGEGIQICEGEGTFGECSGCAENSGWPGRGGGSWGSGGSGWGGSSANGGSGNAGGAGNASGTGNAGGASASGGVGGAGGSGNSGPCANHCTNGIQDCGEPHTDCGSDCPPTSEYTLCDCLFDTPRNGSEICDDSGFDVPASAPPGVLVCLEATGGVVYVATNTAIDVDGAPRCQGWENHGQNPWDHLNYVAQVTCDGAQKTLDVDVSAYAGQTLWFGAHDHPQGGGNGTTACIAIKK